jgi:hypothetical protein
MSLLIFRPRQQTGTAAVFQTITFTAGVDGCGVME